MPVLQADRVARFKAPCATTVRVPARSDVTTVAEVSRIEAQSGDHRKGVTVTGINRDPTAASAFAEAKKIARSQRLIQDPCMMQCVGNCSRAIISGINKRTVSAAPLIWLAANAIHSPDRGLHVRRRIFWRVGDSVFQDCPAPGNGWARAARFDLGVPEESSSSSRGCIALPAGRIVGDPLRMEGARIERERLIRRG